MAANKNNLTTNRKGNLVGGVSQAEAQHRLPNQVQEMINCLPTVDKGLVKRNPTRDVRLKHPDGTAASLYYDPEMFSYEHDRGRLIDAGSEFSVIITRNGMVILDVNSGILFEEGNGLVYTGGSKNYLLPFTGRNGYAATTIKDSIFITNTVVYPKMLGATMSDTFRFKGYVWIKRTDPIDGYGYGCTVTIKDTTTGVVQPMINVPVSDPLLDSIAIAVTLAANINAASDHLTATSVGSMVEISSVGSGYEIVAVNATDTFGDTASFGWGHTVEVITDLPKNVSAYQPVVQVGKKDTSAYWMKFIDGSWKEWYKEGIKIEVNPQTMPHILKRVSDVSTLGFHWELSSYEWNDREIGSEDTNALPIFMDEEVPSPIKDIGFFRNRMMLLSTGGVTLSEVGKYGNLFRTSATAVLDSDRIDARIESRTAIRLAYLALLDDSVILFSSNSQFRFKGGDILSPSSFTVTEIMSYEINPTIRPLLMNERIFFIAKRGEYSAVMQMFVSDNSARSSEATDITSHVQSYVHQDLDRLTGSAINNMLFISSRKDRDTVFVYKYYERDRKLEQSAWFKWTFNGQLYAAFAIGKNFNLVISRENSIEKTDWIMGDGTWRSSREWRSDHRWISTPDSLVAQDGFEQMAIYPQDHDRTFLDAQFAKIPSVVNLGRWFPLSNGKYETRGQFQVKSLQIDYADGSRFDIQIEDITRKTKRVVEFKHHDGRRPMVYGEARNMVITLLENSFRGFRIIDASIEGAINRRAKTK